MLVELETTCLDTSRVDSTTKKRQEAAQQVSPEEAEEYAS